MAKKIGKPARADARKGIELITLRGRKPGNNYLLVKGHIKKGDFFAAFMAHDLKKACADILGIEAQTARRANSNELARKVWKKAQI